MLPVNQVLLLVVVTAAVVTDVRTGKIKNWLTLPAIAIGPFVHLLQSGAHGAVLSLAAMGIMVVLCVPLVALGMFGGGDVKLLVAVGALSGLSLVKDTLLFTGLAGGLLAIIVLIWRRRGAAVTKQLAQAAWMSIALRVSCREGIRTGMKVPYSIAIAAGAIAAVVTHI